MKAINVCEVENYKAIKDLKFHPDNPRNITRERLDDLKRSIVEKGFYQPILVWTKDNIVLAGNHRLKASLELLDEGYTFKGPGKLKNVLPVVIEDVSEEMANALLFDTNNSYADWVQDQLKSALADAQGAGRDLKQYGFSDNQISDLLNKALKDAEGIKTPEPEAEWDKTKEDDIPEESKTKIKVGDVYELGSHRLMCGSSLDEKHVKKLCGDLIPDIVVTDPPYDMSTNDVREALAISRADHFVVIARFITLAELATAPGMKWHMDFVLEADVAKGTYDCDHMPHYKHQNVVYLSNGKTGIFSREAAFGLYKDAYFPSVIPAPRDFKSGHHAKSVEAMYKIIRAFKAKVVMDCFVGAGSTLLACSKAARKCLAMELEPERCQVVIDRWEMLTGQKVRKVK